MKVFYFYTLVFVIMFVFLFSPNSYALDINNKRFTHVTSLGGLSSNVIYCILKDSRGYIWIGTGNGLNRYDGYEIKIYKSSEINPDSISNNFIWSLSEDHNGDIWIGTKGGLNKFDVKNEKFKNISYEQNINEGTIYNLLVNGDNLWIGAARGFYNLDLNSHVIQNVLSEYIVYDIVIKDEYLWLASSDRIFRYSLISEKIKEYILPAGTQVLDIIHYKHRLLLGTSDGVIYFDIETGVIDLKNRLLPGVYVNEMLLDDSENVWIGTRRYGLYIYSIRNKKFDRVFSSVFDEFHLQSNDVAAIVIDNNLWIGSAGGLSYTSLDYALNFFRAANDQVMSNIIYELTMDKIGALWIATDKGVTRYSNEKSTHYEIGSIYNFFFSDSFFLAYVDNNVYKYNKEIDTFEAYALGELIFKKYGVKFIRDILQIGESQYLLATFSGLILWNEKDNTLAKVDYEKELILNTNIELLFQYKEIILLGTMSGLYEFNKKSMSVNRYLIQSNLTLLDKAEIKYIDIDNNDYFWLSTDKGLFKAKNRQVIARYTEDDGLPDTAIRSAVIVNDIIWVSTDKGIGAFKINNDRFKKIHLNADQFNVEFNGGAVYKTKDYLYFGGMEGVLYFKPKRFTNTANPPSINITDLHLYNKPVLPGNELLPNTIGFTDHLVFNHNQNMLTFEFSSMNYSRLSHLYAYQMEGLTNNDDWIVTDAKNRRATFTPSPGEYTFRVKSGWDKTTWSDEIAEVKVTILPPWWRTNWAYTFYIILTLIILIIIYQIRTRSMRLRAVELENQVSERTAELKSTTKEVQTQKEMIEQLMDKKNEMFANISHELRTPITLIKEPITEALSEYPDQQSLLLAERNAQRLSFLVDQLLQLSRMYDFPNESKHTQSLSQIAEAIAASFQSISISQHVTFIVKIEAEVYVSALPNAIDTLLINLISNAFKYTENDGQIILKITQQDKKAVISVKDTGIGMPEDKLQNIFDRFTRIESEMNKKVQGVGVGLALVKQLVKLHQGEITVNSKEGEGTEFMVELNASESPAEISLNDEALGQDSIKQIHYIESQFQSSHQQSLKQQYNIIQTNALIKPKLLIIDDTDDMREYLESLLSTQYQCLLACNGDEGIVIVNEEHPDIIILDVMMPGISGFDVLDKLREDLLTSHIPVLLLTAKGDRESKILGLSKLADDYITKPFDAEELKARIHSILVIRQLQQRKIQKLIDDNTCNENEWKKADLSFKEKDFLDKLNDAMANNYHDEKFTVVELASKIHISDRALLYKLKGLLGKSPNEFIRESRLNKAKELMLTEKVNIADLAESVGFSNASYFHRCFKAYVGCTPKQFIGEKDI